MFFTPSLLCSTSQCYGSLDASFSFPLAELHRFVESPPCPVGKRSSHMVVSSSVGSPPNSGFEKIAAGKRCRRALLQGSPANDPVDSASMADAYNHSFWNSLDAKDTLRYGRSAHKHRLRLNKNFLGQLMNWAKLQPHFLKLANLQPLRMSWTPASYWTKGKSC
ncbi:hypothetical protein GOP47_0000061 [Adiantum capillus-veneris]|uniref:Uncharacterized protein n=1 Tax=Adiantum capillus-veneris TaxID=13818 RepID=A0A9D4VEE0_ADICA|nr:hypothetical protein GOP47_0000061 [Adiantum capillus-veneris]